MGEEDKRIKSELEEDLSRTRLELRQALSELQVQKEEMRQRQQSKDKEVTIGDIEIYSESAVSIKRCQTLSLWANPIRGPMRWITAKNMAGQ